MSIDPGYFTNRDLSWLDFNGRVLQEAQDEGNPLLERVKFLSITASNLDEFFMVRVAGIKQLIEAGIVNPDASGLSPKEQLKAISQKIHTMALRQYDVYKELDVLLRTQGIDIVRVNGLSGQDMEFADAYYANWLQPVLTPLAIDAARPFPHVSSKRLNIGLRLKGQDCDVYAMVQVPLTMERVVRLPSGRYTMLEDILLAHARGLFTGYDVKGIILFRITRDADLTIDEDAEDLMREIEQSLSRRRWGHPVRIEIMSGFTEDAPDARMLEFLAERLNIRKRDIYLQDGPLDLTFLSAIASLDKPGLKFVPRLPLEPVLLKGYDDIFDAMRERDILVSHPYESFDCVIDFVSKAAADPDVLAIKQTLYRVSGDSPVVDALIRAADAGKQVTVLVELKARFDEENNIGWAKALEQAGCHVIYGLTGLKVHCKVLLVVRREAEGIRRYLHMSTGNYNDSTARLYTDMGLFTCDKALCSDASALFNVLTGYSAAPHYRKIKTAPLDLRKFFYDKIDREIENARRGLPSGFTAKVNALIDEGMIEKLYEASMAGVQVNLIVRGINGLRSKIPGLSDNIRVISIIGRYLEHNRIFMFCAGGENEVYLSSADFMQRNLDRRIEVLFPVEQQDIRERIKNGLGLMLSDNVKAREQQQDGSYKYVEAGDRHISSQDEFYLILKKEGLDGAISRTTVFKPRKRP